eukprot:762295-Amorphochlora_amoeboformis.AAC.1
MDHSPAAKNENIQKGKNVSVPLRESLSIGERRGGHEEKYGGPQGEGQPACMCTCGHCHRELDRKDNIY